MEKVQQRLMEAAEAGDIKLLYGCIQDYPKILDSIDETPFVDTPLHIAALAGHAYFALEMMRLKPSFGRKLNPQGLSPLALALRRREALGPEDQDLQKNLTWTIRRLINFDEELIRVRGRESFTPLHYVAEKGDIDLLAEFLLACPESIMDRTIQDETALHIAVKNSKLEACKVLLGWLCRSLNQNLLNSTDEKGNTVLDIAVSNSQTEIEAILRCAGALESSSSPTEDSCAVFLKSPERWIEKIFKNPFFLETFLNPNPNFFSMSMETRNVILVVAVLVATCTYQAVFNPPGGVRGLGGDNNNQLTTNANGTLMNATIISTTGLTTNVSHFNVTIFTPTVTNTNYNSANQVLYHPLFHYPLVKKDFTYRDFFIQFYLLNTVCFFFSILTIAAALPVQPLVLMLHFSILFLILSYGFSFHAISPSHSTNNYFTIGSTLFCFIFYLLVVCPNMIRVLLTQLYKSRLPLHLHRERVEMLKLCLKGRPQKS